MSYTREKVFSKSRKELKDLRDEFFIEDIEGYKQARRTRIKLAFKIGLYTFFMMLGGMMLFILTYGAITTRTVIWGVLISIAIFAAPIYFRFVFRGVAIPSADIDIDINQHTVVTTYSDGSSSSRTVGGDLSIIVTVILLLLRFAISFIIAPFVCIFTYIRFFVQYNATSMLLYKKPLSRKIINSPIFQVLVLTIIFLVIIAGPGLSLHILALNGMIN